MKREFSFNLAPVKVPSRSDSQAKQTSAPPSSHASSYASPNRRHLSRESLSSPDSPFICRRPLDPRTEQELRAACALILKNFKPSDHDFADADPKLDFSGPHKPRYAVKEVRVHRPAGAPSEPKGAHDTKKHSHSADVANGRSDLPLRANTGRRRVDHSADRDTPRGRQLRSPTYDAPRSATLRTETDSDDAKSLGTPLTASTDAHLNGGSTAPTSVALNSGKSSKRGSHQFESAGAIADAQASEWMHYELEKRRQQAAAQPRSELHSSHRPPSRASSIKAGIKEYIFPGSTRLSRSQSRDSIRTTDSQSSSQLKRSGSSHGWRSWGLQRNSSSRTSSRPGTSGARIEGPEPEKKVELNLNRELPPLPSLDTWSEPVKQNEQRKSQVQGAHIATLMRTQDQTHHQQRQEYAAAVRQHHRRSGSDTLALRYSTYRPQHSTHTNHHQSKPAPDTSGDFDQMMSAMSSTRNLDDQLKLHPMNHHGPQRSISTHSRSPSSKVSQDGRPQAPNFSRKISTDMPPHPPAALHNHDPTYRNVVQITGPTNKAQQKGKLKRVLSSWMMRKEKKDDWMLKFERGGIRKGVMVQDEAALPPVVRY